MKDAYIYIAMAVTLAIVAFVALSGKKETPPPAPATTTTTGGGNNIAGLITSGTSLIEAISGLFNKKKKG